MAYPDDPRMIAREVGEIHYCVLCHERDRTRSLHERRKVSVNPLDRASRAVRREDLEMHLLRKEGDAVGAPR